MKGMKTMSLAKRKGHENLEAVHESILEDGKKRFPIESYRLLRDAGAGREEALELLGYESDDHSLPELE